MSLDMQEGRKPSAASLTRECAFEDGENFDELPVRRLTVSRTACRRAGAAACF